MRLRSHLPLAVGRLTMLSAFAAACGDDDSTPSDAGIDGGGSAGTGGSGGSGAHDGGGSGGYGSGGSGATDGGTGGALGDAGAKLSDAEIASIMMTANTGEVQEGQVGKMRASATSVHDFATRMVNDHTTANDMLMTVLQNISITPASNPTSQMLMNGAAREITKLKKESGNAFDLEYMNASVRDHRQVLTLIDNRLLPDVQNAMLKSHLSSMRTTVKEHLTAAREILGMLEGDAGAEDAGH
jgi:putative membrane protein